MTISATLLLAQLTTTALAQESAKWDNTDPIDIGILKDKDISVVQQRLYPKSKHKELGAHLGVMPFDPFSVTPKLELSYGQHLSETLAWEATLGGGYGLKSSNYTTLETMNSVEPDVYRYLTSLVADIQYAPIYAKMALDGKRLFHYDGYLLAGGGLTIEQAFMPDGDISLGPTLSLGLGSRIFLRNGNALRAQLRDDLILQSRSKTGEFYLKQNVTFSIGYVLLQK